MTTKYEKIEKLFMIAIACYKDAQIKFKKDMKIANISQEIELGAKKFVKEYEQWLQSESE